MCQQYIYLTSKLSLCNCCTYILYHKLSYLGEINFRITQPLIHLHIKSCPQCVGNILYKNMAPTLLSLPCFDYHYRLHHSQTPESFEGYPRLFDYHYRLHHSQTDLKRLPKSEMFDYHYGLHHSQTRFPNNQQQEQFDYHYGLHHSQT